MTKEWHELTRLTRGETITIERIRLAGSDIAIEGSFELPPLARLSSEDQIFVMAFVRCHGSIKKMEEVFGISYPTVKSRIQRIAKGFSFFDEIPLNEQEDKQEEEVLKKLDSGEISAEEAIERLSQ